MRSGEDLPRFERDWRRRLKRFFGEGVFGGEVVAVAVGIDMVLV